MFYRFTFDLISKPFLLLIVILFILFHLQKLPKNEVIWFWFPVAFSIELTYDSGSLDISHVSICSSPFKCLENEKLSNGQLKLQAHWTHWTVPAKTAVSRFYIQFVYFVYILFVFAESNDIPRSATSLGNCFHFHSAEGNARRREKLWSIGLGI